MMLRKQRYIRLYGLLLALILVGCAGEQQDQEGASDTPTSDNSESTLLVGRIEGAIGPVTLAYVERVLKTATDLPAQALILTMDTPGGLESSMREIIKKMLASPIPIIVYVSPGGARAASAGAIITLASHIAAMAPSTNIGAAHPVSIGQGEMDEVMSAKVTNDAAAFAKGLATKRGRDIEWAEKIVRESISSTAEEVLAIGVIDYIAPNLETLIKNIDGRTVELEQGESTLATLGAPVRHIDPTLREKILARIADPNIAYLLMLAGIFGIFFELQNPGAIFPGVIGGISILLAFFALQVLPINYAGLALIIFAIIMFVLEVKVPSGGLLTIGGVISMFIGSIMLIDSPFPFMRVSLSVIIPSVIATALFFLFAVGLGLRAQRTKVATGESGMQGEVGRAETDILESGSVFVHGEHWSACSDERIEKGDSVQVVSLNGLKLKVKRHT